MGDQTDDALGRPVEYQGVADIVDELDIGP